MTEAEAAFVAADVAGARRGDPAAFGRLARRWDHQLRGVAWAVVRDARAVDDVMQRAYEQAFRSIDSFTGASSLKTWLQTIVYRTAVDDVGPIGGPSSTGEAAFDRLDAETRALVMLTGAAGTSFDEAAEVTGVERGTIASRVSRARTALREEMLR